MAIRRALGIGTGPVAVIGTGTVCGGIVSISPVAVTVASAAAVMIVVFVSRVAALGIVHKITS